jgi:hypothetical protein
MRAVFAVLLMTMLIGALLLVALPDSADWLIPPAASETHFDPPAIPDIKQGK